MFAIEKVLSQVQSNGSTFSGENLGTLKQSLKSSNEVSFSNKNLSGDKRVTVVVYDNTKTDQAPYQISCSERVSAIVRKALKAGQSHKVLLQLVINLPIVKNDTGIFISAQGVQAQRFSTEALGTEQAVTFEELLVL